MGHGSNLGKGNLKIPWCGVWRKEQRSSVGKGRRKAETLESICWKKRQALTPNADTETPLTYSLQETIACVCGTVLLACLLERLDMLKVYFPHLQIWTQWNDRSVFRSLISGRSEFQRDTSPNFCIQISCSASCTWGVLTVPGLLIASQILRFFLVLLKASV